MTKNIEKWGRDTARARYSESPNIVPAVPDRQKFAGSATDGMSYPGTGDCYPQKLGDDGNLQDPKYANNTPSNWLRGVGPGQAQGKPGYDLTGKNPKGVK